jgi:hypothetical protein
MRRVALGTMALYVVAAVTGRILEALGVSRCGCSRDCWCQRPGLSTFRWVFPWGHRSIGQQAKERLSMEVVGER